MHNIPQEDLEKICQSMKREEGSFSFEYCSKNLMNQENASYLSIFKIVSGNYIFLLERDQNFSLNFYQTSPRKGTRVAAIDLEHISKCEKVFIALTWSPDEICLYLGPKIPGSELVYAKGKLSDIDLCVGSDGNIYFHTSDVIMNLNIMQDGKKILSPLAIKSWSDTKKALEVLWTGKSNEGYMFEVLLANITISMLVTGFEVYTKKRIIELEEGGGNPRTESFFLLLNRRS